MIVSPWRYGTYTPSLCSAGGYLFGKSNRKKHFPDSIIEVGKKGGQDLRVPPKKDSKLLLTGRNDVTTAVK